MVKLAYWTLSLLSSVWISCAGAESITMAVPKTGYPPYLVVEGQQVGGILGQILKTAADEQGHSVVFVFMPENRSLHALRAKEIDVRMESPAWTDNPEQFVWSDPVVEIHDQFVFNKRLENHFESDESMVGAEIVTHLGYGYPTLQGLFDSKTITRRDYRTELAMLNSLLRESFEDKRAAVMDRHVALWLINRNPRFKDKLAFSERIVDSMPLHYQFAPSARLERFCHKLNRYIETIRQNGDMHEIIKRALDY